MDNQTGAQPAFWLEVKKEYVVENFEKLLGYLRFYRYTPALDSTNDDFMRSLKCLEDVTKELIADLEKQTLFHTAEDLWGENTTKNIRMMATCLLAQQKIGKADTQLLARLADVVLLSARKSITYDLLERLKSLVLCCARGQDIKELGIGWSYVANAGDFTLDVFAHLLGNTRFKAPDSLELWAHEHNGVMVIENGKVSIAPMNGYDYRKGKLKTQLQLSLGDSVDVNRGDYTNKHDAPQLRTIFNQLLMDMRKVKPSPESRMLTYEDGDLLVARITATRPYIKAVSTDETYETVSGRVDLASPVRSMDNAEMASYLEVGDLLLVDYDEKNHQFLTDLTLNEYREDCLESYVGATEDAVFLEPYLQGKGLRWMMENGLTVNSLDATARWNDEINQAVATRQPVRIVVKEAKKDSNGHMVLNGKIDIYDFSQHPLSGDDFIRAAHKNFTRSFVDYSASQLSTALPVRNMADCGPLAPLILGHIYYNVSMLSSSTEERMRDLVASALLLSIAQKEEDVAFVAHEIAYQDCLVRFADGTAGGELTAFVDPRLANVPRVMSEERVLAALNRYANADASRPVQDNTFSEADLEYLNNMVDASNTLNGKIGAAEVNRIKRSIASFLGVGDSFSNIISDGTYYGEESNTLEFKTSVVYPAGNKMRPDINAQVWNILKQVCGMLNTVSGGEILVGVNDAGYSCGLRDDLDYLYRHRYIPEMSMDKLRLWLKYKIDHAFRDEHSMASGMDITSTRVNYIIEQNGDGNDVLHIHVSPYEYGIVTFADTDRPEGVARCYYRTSCSTVVMDENVRADALKNKFTAAKSSETDKYLQLRRAIGEHKVIKLCGYTSRKGTEDKLLEPFKLFPQLQTVVGYDLSRRKVAAFRVSRAERMEVTEQNWKHGAKNKDIQLDIFGMLESGENKPVELELKLGNLARNILVEEHPMAAQSVSQNHERDSKTYPWLLQTTVYGLHGIGRFYLGMAEYIRIVKAEGLAEYASQYVKACQIV